MEVIITNGNKRIVWRCIERLTNGTQNCKNSPTIFEEDLHNAIIDSLKELLPNSGDIAKKVRDEIEAVIMKNDDNNPQVIQRRIQSLKKEGEILRNILRETDDKEFYVDKINGIENEVLNLKDRFDTVNKYKIAKEIVGIGYFINMRELNINHHFDTFIKSIVKCVIINSEQGIGVVYMNQNLNK